MRDWQEITTAPKNEPVLVCGNDCKIVVGIQKEYDTFNEKGKPQREWTWLLFAFETSYRGGMIGVCYNTLAPKMWQSLPMPPKHLYERKLTADLLEKQVQELRK